MKFRAEIEVVESFKFWLHMGAVLCKKEKNYLVSDSLVFKKLIASSFSTYSMKCSHARKYSKH